MTDLPRFLSLPQRSPGGRLAAKVAGAGLATVLWLTFLGSLPSVYEVRVNDFPAYWAAGKMVVTGNPEKIYSPDWKWFTNLPIVAVFAAPLGALEYDTAWQVLWWISVACFAATFALLAWAVNRYFPPLGWAGLGLIAAIFFAFAPVMRRCLSLGQTTPLMVLLFAVIYVLVRERRDVLAGALLGLICVIKIPPLLLLPLLVLRRRLGLAAAAACVFALGVLSSWVFFGSDLMQQYADRVIWDNFGRVHAAFNNQSLDGAFMRMFTDRGLADWVPVEPPALERAAVFAVLGTLGALLLATGRRVLWPAAAPVDSDRLRGSLELELGLGVALMVLVFPIVWIHYYLFLVVPLCVLPFWWRQRELPWRWTAVALFAAGTWLAGGLEAGENAAYAAREGELWFRLLQNLQPLGALCLIGAFAFPLAGIARRSEGE